MDNAEQDVPRVGLLQSLRTHLATLIALGQTRLELLGVELQEEAVRLVRLAVLAGIAGFFLALGVLVVTFFLVLLFWDTHRLLVTGLLAVMYLLIGVLFAVAARKCAQTKSKLFTASLAELQKDRDQLNEQ